MIGEMIFFSILSVFLGDLCSTTRLGPLPPSQSHNISVGVEGNARVHNMRIATNPALNRDAFSNVIDQKLHDVGVLLRGQDQQHGISCCVDFRISDQENRILFTEDIPVDVLGNDAPGGGFQFERCGLHLR